MQSEVLVAATLAVSHERESFTTNYTSILKIVRFNAQNVAQFDAYAEQTDHSIHERKPERHSSSYQFQPSHKTTSVKKD